MNSLSDEELIRRVQEGDGTAFEELVRRHDRKVLAIALSYTRNEADAQDIYQEVFLRVHRALGAFEFRSKFTTWLHRVTVNACLTHRARSKAHLYDSLDAPVDERDPMRNRLQNVLSDGDEPEHQVLSGEIAAQIDKAMAALSDRQRLVFTLRHHRGHKIREIAEMLDCAEGTVKKYLFTATERVRDRLRPVYRNPISEAAGHGT